MQKLYTKWLKLLLKTKDIVLFLSLVGRLDLLLRYKTFVLMKMKSTFQ